MPVINIIICLMYTAKITIIITKQKTIIFDGQICHERGKIEMISFKLHTKTFFSWFFYLQFTKIPWEMKVINIIFWLMYTLKNTIIIINKKILLFVVCRFHKWGITRMIYFETKQKIISNNVFLISASQSNIREWK